MEQRVRHADSVRADAITIVESFKIIWSYQTLGYLACCCWILFLNSVSFIIPDTLNVNVCIEHANHVFFMIHICFKRSLYYILKKNQQQHFKCCLWSFSDNFPNKNTIFCTLARTKNIEYYKKTFSSKLNFKLTNVLLIKE